SRPWRSAIRSRPGTPGSERRAGNGSILAPLGLLDEVTQGLHGLDLERKLFAIDRTRLRPHDLGVWHQLFVRAAIDREDLDLAEQRCRDGLVAAPYDTLLAVRAQELAAQNRVDELLSRVLVAEGAYVPEKIEEALVTLDLATLRSAEKVAWHEA